MQPLWMLRCMRCVLYDVYVCMGVPDATVGSIGLHGIGRGGTEFRGTQKKTFLAKPRLIRFRPEPGFFRYWIFID